MAARFRSASAPVRHAPRGDAYGVPAMRLGLDRTGSGGIAMIFPLSHENMHGRRWPYVTIAIIALNTLFFVVTHGQLEREAQQLAQVREHVLLLDAVHPKTPMNQAEQSLVDAFRRSQPDTWERWGSPNRQAASLWDLQMRNWEPDRCAQEMGALGAQLDQLQQTSLVARYAFFPSHPTWISYLTANFLHGGWLHLIFNMWFLWLAGAVLEDVWGRPIYAAFYLISGVVALWAYALVYPHGLIPVIGASGAIASLMGAFLVRFPKSRIHLGFFYWIVRPRLVRFQMPAYAVLPLWLGLQFFWGMLAGESGGVAYWAHIGGFGFGVILALLLRYSGIEHKVDKAIEAKVSWSAGEHLVKAGELLEKQQFDGAIAELRAEIAEKPESIDAYEMLPSVYWRKGDVPAYLQALETVCQLHLKARNTELAWQDYEDYARAGGEKMPAAAWLEMCRYLEGQQHWERASAEYEKLAQAWPSDRASVLALISAGRIQLRQLGRREEALRLYTAAQDSPVPHADWAETIRKGREAASGTGKLAPVSSSTGSPSS
jgi:membrane associated rhomboid family serine protease